MGTETGTRLSIDQNSILTDAFKLKPVDAIEHLRQKGYAFSWNWYDMWQEAHQHAFTVAKVMKLDILQDIRNMVDKATENGWAFEKFKRQLEPMLQAKGWWGKKEIVDKETGEVKNVQLGSVHRLRTIYETNLSTQYAAGRWKGQYANRVSRPYLQFLAILDQNTTDTCRRLHNLIVRIDDPIVDKIYPPNHYNCRLTVRTLSQRQVDRDKLPVESSEGRIREKTVVVGGKPVKVTGFDTGRYDNNGDPVIYWTQPGWDYNPGKVSFKPDLQKYDPDIAALFKKEEAKRLELPKAEPLLSRMPVKKAADLEPLLQQYHNENPGMFLNGFKGVKTKRASYFMATDGHGTIWISSLKSSSGFNPQSRLISALKKISSNKELEFMEEYAIESLWHEILHNRAKGMQRLVKLSKQQIMMETLNQFVARHTYPEFMAKLGGKAVFADQVLAEGLGYKRLVANFRTLLSELKLNEKAILGRLRYISFNSKWSEIDKDVARELSALGSIPVTKITICLDLLRLQSTDFITVVRKILQ